MLDYTAEYSGKKVVVTGAAGVFGTWLAEAFAAAGADLLVTDGRREKVEALAERLGARAVVADLTSDEGLAAIVSAFTDGWGAPDVLVNNAGIYPRTPYDDTELALVRKMLDINVVAPFELSRQAMMAMVARGVQGRIVNISSGAAIRPGSTSAIYAGTKAAIELMTKSMAMEVAHHGIRINAVRPGFAPGSEVSNLGPQHTASMLGRIPLGRSSGPNDMPQAVLWLCSDAASFVTGSTVSVDGGRAAGDYVRPSLGDDQASSRGDDQASVARVEERADDAARVEERAGEPSAPAIVVPGEGE